MIVVSNTSPIINIAAVGHLNLLKELYGELIIPEGVYDEIVGAEDAGAREIQTCA